MKRVRARVFYSALRPKSNNCRPDYYFRKFVVLASRRAYLHDDTNHNRKFQPVRTRAFLSALKRVAVRVNNKYPLTTYATNPCIIKCTCTRNRVRRVLVFDLGRDTPLVYGRCVFGTRLHSWSRPREYPRTNSEEIKRNGCATRTTFARYALVSTR